MWKWYFYFALPNRIRCYKNIYNILGHIIRERGRVYPLENEKLSIKSTFFYTGMEMQPITTKIFIKNV